MSDPRRYRKDDRERHDGKVSRKLSGPVIRLDPATMQPIDPLQQISQRYNVTAADDKAKAEAKRKEIDALGALTFDQQKEAIRRANSVLLARTLAAVEGGAADEATITALAKCSTIAKQWTTEERQQGGTGDPAKMSDDEIRRALAK
jgi:hypothetical protein